MRLALGKRVPATNETGKVAAAHAAAAVVGGDDSSRTLAAAAEFIGDHQAKQRIESEDESESRASDPTGTRVSPPAVSRVQPASPEPRETAALAPPEASIAQTEGASQSTEAAVTTQGRKKKNKEARKAAREAGNGPPAVGPGGGAGGQASSVAELPRRKRQCPVFGCTRKHAPNDCPTFLDMTPKERLDLVHMKQLCLLCLRHPTSVGCEVVGKGSNCSAGGCNKPHHVTLHGILKAGESSPPMRGADPPDGPTAAAAADKAPDLVRQLRGLLEDLGIDPDALEVRIGFRRPGEQGRPHGGGAVNPSATETGEGKLTGKLLEALTLLCRAGERFMSSAGEDRQRMIEAADPAAAPGEGPCGERSRSATRDAGCVPRRDGSKATGRRPAMRGEEDSADEDGEERRGLVSGAHARGNQESLEEWGGLQRVVVLMPGGGQLINMGIGRGFEFSVVSQRTATRYAVDGTKLQTPIMLEGPSGASTRATELCTIVFPQEKAVGGKMVIYAYVADALEE